MSATVTDFAGSITFDSGFFAEIVSASWSGLSRAAIETTHAGVAAPGAGTFGNKTFIPSSFSDPGSIDVELHHDADTIPPIDSAAETLTFTFNLDSGETTASTWAASGFMTDFSWTGAIDGKRTASATIKFSGNVTRTAST